MSIQQAKKYHIKRDLSGGRTSTLRKTDKAYRIAKGLRPYPMPRPATPDGRMVLHPTKGWVRA